jgi:hypothetical protein
MNGAMDASRRSPVSLPTSGAPRTFAVPFAAALTVMVAMGCSRGEDPIVSEFTETFDRDEIGPGWRDSGGNFRIEKGELVARKARRHPLWLRKSLPPDVAIEFDAHTESERGNIRVILFGDGKSASSDPEGCGSTGYALVFGGWNNKLSVICRGEQADGGHTRARSDWPVVAGRPYHFYVTRKGGTLSWYVGGHTFLEWNDPSPLAGSGHTAFGFDGGEEEVFFDNLTITPLHE